MSAAVVRGDVAVLIAVLIVCVVGVALWVGRLVRDANERFDQLEHKLDIVIDQLEDRRS